jgi:hypothetical protein
VSKRVWLAGLLATLSIGLMSAKAVADDPIAPFVSSQTDAVIYVDLSAVDMDALQALQQKITAQLPPDQAAKAQAQQPRIDQQMAQMRKWIDGFKQAGGKDVYVVVQLSGIFTGKAGALLVPILPGVDSAALAKYLNPAGAAPPEPGIPPNPMAPKTEVIGQMLVFAPGPMIADFKSGTAAQPRPDLGEGLAAAGAAPFRLVIVPASLKRSPMLAMVAANMGGGRQPGGPPGAPPAAPLSEPQWDNVTWVAISGALPPKESGNFTCQCKDADSANAVADMINKKIEERRNDPKAQQLGADADKLAAALKPKVDGTKVVIDVDQDTVDNVLIPVMIKASAMGGGPANGPGPGGPPAGTPPGTPAPPEGGGM